MEKLLSGDNCEVVGFMVKGKKEEHIPCRAFYSSFDSST